MPLLVCRAAVTQHHSFPSSTEQAWLKKEWTELGLRNQLELFKIALPARLATPNPGALAENRKALRTELATLLWNATCRKGVWSE